ncbi:hypothetical protein ACFQHV_18890 [Promicromonospora thailandica]|uniref:Uncharacterized protein n=1 Tax=Promicromonospora thailandica TaxID=765201 RepID=A0A9X2GB79_9MICO|nr:hypothetical protein [Promicromonospora thailandica]MCP2265266.1 hypothetical protein [Promicromonospora thailandica]BFF19644.1 hypothetical protein GCM10025730_31650 [Promicromonospora thailandica]
MSNFEVARRQKQEPTATLLVRVIVCFALFLAGLVLIGIGSSDTGASSPFLFVGGILTVGLSFGLPMIGATER